MNTKLLIGALGIVALVIIFYSTRPGEVVAPALEQAQSDISNTPQGETSTTAPSLTIEATPAGETVVPPKPTPAPVATTKAPTLPYSATIVYDGDRFIPEMVTIIEGGTVRFMNTSTEKMWIGADNHPAHDRYPVKSEGDCLGSSFDQCASVGSGASWSYTFTRTGTWGYHNHARARDTGSVKVMTSEEYIKTR